MASASGSPEIVAGNAPTTAPAVSGSQATVSGLIEEVVTTLATTTPAGADESSNRSLIACLVSVGVIIVVVVVVYLVLRKICKSPREKHGIETMEGQPPPTNGIFKKKVQYYDQFNVNDHQLTVNSVTALKWDEDEEKLSNKSSGIDCDSFNSDPKEGEKKVQVGAGKKVFSVNKVPERKGRPGTSANGGSSNMVTVRLPKEYRDVARSLQSGDTKKYTLALIDKNSKTIHNIDMSRNRRVMSPLASLYEARPRHNSGGSHRPRHQSAGQRSRRRSGGDSHRARVIHATGLQSDADVYRHDSPDIARKPRRGTLSADELNINKKVRLDSSSTDYSDTSFNEQKRSASISSQDDGVSSLPLLTEQRDEQKVLGTCEGLQPGSKASTESAPAAADSTADDRCPGDGETEKLLVDN